MESKGVSAYIAEFIGTFVLVLFIGLILAANSKVGLGYTDFAVIGLLHAFTLAMIIATLGGVSGAHFNPAVTVTLAALRKISVVDSAIYIVLQLAGAIAAALVVKAMFVGVIDITNPGAPTVNKAMLPGNFAAFCAELIGTFVLMFAIVGMAVNPRSDTKWAPWIIGTTLGFAVMAIGPLTGAGLNPARSFGPALVFDAFGSFGTWAYIYIGGPLIGALLAGIIYQVVVINPAKGEAPVDTLPA